MTDTKRTAQVIRWYRWIHRKIAIFLFFFFLVISVTGVLLGLKKQTGLLAPTQKGISADPATWLSIDSLKTLAIGYLHDSVSLDLSTELDRIDIRPGKGIAKFLFTDHYNALQLDLATGRLLLIEKRRSDYIEKLHDGSILDKFFGTGGDQVKISYTVIMGLSLLMLIVSGFWLWYGPKKIRQAKKKTHAAGT